MDLSAHIRKHALSIPGKQQLIMSAFAKALEIIPRQISDNAGLDSTDILNKLRMKHAKGEKWAGVDVDGADGVRDNMDAFVWEPSLVKTNAISSAAEAACLILSVDETVRNPQSEQVSASSYICTSSLIKNFFNSQVLDHGHHQALHNGRCEAEAEGCLGDKVIE
jgi:T-complex protein 1 subunit eta